MQVHKTDISGGYKELQSSQYHIGYARSGISALLDCALADEQAPVACNLFLHA